MTTYTINVVNQSGASKSYVVFQAPPPAFGGQTPVYTNAWAALEHITDSGFDSVTYTVEGSDHEVPRFLVTEGDYTPGQVIDPPEGGNVATVDFTGLPQTAAAVTEHPDGEFSVDYVS
ncbi:hypothetical protein [Caulobacter sp.]|uniref:hypothetical protein n=1 Tax=Caulobacter sp. TaxID=78 RepID=UPI003BB00CF4